MENINDQVYRLKKEKELFREQLHRQLEAVNSRLEQEKVQQNKFAMNYLSGMRQALLDVIAMERIYLR